VTTIVEFINALQRAYWTPDF